MIEKENLMTIIYLYVKIYVNMLDMTQTLKKLYANVGLDIKNLYYLK